MKGFGEEYVVEGKWEVGVEACVGEFCIGVEIVEWVIVLLGE